MTEHEWLTSATPWAMIEFVGTENNVRKLRLFTCACCRQVLNPFTPALAERSLTASEMFADGRISPAALGLVSDAVFVATQAARESSPRDNGYLCHLLEACGYACRSEWRENAARKAAHATARAAADMPWPSRGDPPPEFADELAAQADLVRDIFGNPFRSSEIHLEWLTADVLALARGVYADRAFDRMPMLADALQDAGCDDEDILGHCRDPRDHVRGCWVVDLLMGKR